MMVPFDGTGGPQQGNPSVGPQSMQRPPMPPGHNPGGQVMQPGHHPTMNPPPYGHRQGAGMQGQPPPFGMPPQSPATRQGNYGGMPGNGQYSSHPPLHSPHQQPGGPPPMPPHPGMQPPHQQHQPMHRSNSLGRGPSGYNMPPMPPPVGPPNHAQQQQQQQHVDPMQQQRQAVGAPSMAHSRPPPPQQQQYMGNTGGGGGMGPPGGGAGGQGLSGSWQSDTDTPHRREMIQHIVKLLKKDKNGSPESMNKLPQMAKQLEVSLYRNARSFEAYMDMSTLKQRLQQIAVEVSRKTRTQGEHARQDDSRLYNDRSHSFAQQNNGMRPGSVGPPGANSPFMGSSNPDPSGFMVNMDDINPMANSVGPDMMRQNGSSYGGSRSLQMQERMNKPPPPQQQQQPQQQQPAQQMQQRSNVGSSNSSMAQSTNSQNRNDAEFKIRIRHKQQRLLLLHHSAKCMAEDGRCSVTPHCADMKRLWRHMEGCKDNNCRISHCFSSRAILSHYRKCKDANCPACGPVRETVRKSRSANPSSRAMQSNSTGPMMNEMRGMPAVAPPPVAPPQQQPLPPQQRIMQSSQDPLGTSLGSSYSSGGGGPSMGPSSYSQPPMAPQPPAQPPARPSMHQGSNMPPPSSGPVTTSAAMQYSSSYPQNRPPSSTSNPVAPAQPLYGSDRPSSNADNRISSSSNARAANDSPTAVQLSSSIRPGSGTGGSSGGGSGGGSSRNDSEWQKIRHKQQRLLLLRHASRCQHEAGKCPVTPHCASMKRLWEHIAHCKNQQCTVQHCLSSRYVLSHYRRCKDPRCPACGPVRETIRKSHEREKSRQQQGGGTGSNNKSGSSVTSNSFDNDRMIGRDDGFSLPAGSGSPTMEDSGSPPMEAMMPERKKMRIESRGTTPPPVQASSSSSSAPLLDRSTEPVVSLHQHDLEMPPSPTSPDAEPPARSPSPPVRVPTPPPSAPALVKSKSESREPTPTPSVAPTSEPVDHPKSLTGKIASKEMKGLVDRSLLDSFTVEELETHLKSLERKSQLPPAKLKAKCMEVLKGLQGHQHGWVFNCPVDPVELGLPDYFDIIKKPMDLGTIQKKLENGAYHSLDDFSVDVCLTFDNAMTYNEEGSVVFDMAKELKTKFDKDLKKLMGQLESEDRERRQNERACTLCGCEKLLFEPPVYFCSGTNCQSQRIRRNSHFYIGGNNQYYWCSSCFNELDDKVPIELVDMTITKADLKKKKNDEVHEESWVQCDSCERWVHQICGLFNTRLNKEHHSEYCCPKCLCEKRKNEQLPCAPKPASAADLPRTMLSEWLEQHVTKRLVVKKREMAEEKAVTESISLEEATRQVESGGPVIIRQVTSMDRKHEVRELMKKRYAHKNYPDEFPFRCKCILVFQKLDGVDVVLFALYVYEHGEDSPPPNQRIVYISYLDSVHFMKPRRLRTFVYHEILIAYLDYARRKGFALAHIWACPPLKGDDYIFYAKPEDQKTPRDGRLRQWYIDMLTECQKRNIVGKVTNMYDYYLVNEKMDATAIPYLEGDYFPGEAENIIKMLEEGGGKKGGGGGKKKKSKSNTNKNTVKTKATGTRSTGVDEEALIASGCYDGAKNLKELDRDPVMVKLGETIFSMKESFIVAFLNWSGAKEEDLVVPEAIEKARIEYAAKEDGDFTGRKRDALGQVRDAMSSTDKDGNAIKVIDDDDEDLDCEFLNNRQAFLNLCRGNHYQFDELRRAKHTSMMVLWHLHNRDAPKFVQQCVSCSREILSGKRYHCNTCPDYDLCQECYSDPKASRGACTHKLQPIAVEPDPGSERTSGLTEKERQQRQRNLMLHIQLIEHASRCSSKSCSSTNCAKMKQYLQHAQSCRIKVQGGCKICKRIWTLLRIHAQKCKDPQCHIPQCTAIREKMRQLQKQQQAMDDRRRVEMNRHMRFSGAGGG